MKSIVAAFLFAMLHLCAARPAGAGDNATLRWSGCSSEPELNAIEPYTAGPHVLTVTIDGGYGPIAWSAFEATIVVIDRCSSDGQFIPQAWRFDAGGCNAGAMQVARPASYDGCPGLGATTTLDVATTTVREEAVGRDNFLIHYPALEIRIRQEFPRVWLQASRYVAAQITFDMSNTVAGTDPAGIACGCASVPREIALVSARLIGDDGPMDLSVQNYSPVYWADGAGCVIDAPKVPTADWGADPACLTTAAHARTWGAIKASYR